MTDVTKFDTLVHNIEPEVKFLKSKMAYGRDIRC